MKKFLPLWMSILVATALLILASAPAAVAGEVTYSFNLIGPQTASNGTPGTETIAVTGTGSFDAITATTGTVVASGLFLITNNSTEAVVSAGTWKATGFNSFCPRGGKSPGFQGGVLVITVTLFPRGREPITGVTMTITCAVGTGCGATKDEIAVTGSIGNFTDTVRAANLFHLNQ